MNKKTQAEMLAHMMESYEVDVAEARACGYEYMMWKEWHAAHLPDYNELYQGKSK